MDEEKIKAMYADIVDVINKHDLKYEEDLMCATLLLMSIVRDGARLMGLDEEKTENFIDDIIDSIRKQMNGENVEEQTE